LRRAEDRAAAVGGREPALLVDERLERQSVRDALERRAASSRRFSAPSSSSRPSFAFATADFNTRMVSS
jgi:hypothetical protein